MLAGLLKSVPNAVLAAVAMVWAIGWGSTPAYAQCGCCQRGGSHAGHSAGSTGHDRGTVRDERASHNQAAPPHGGQLTTADPLTFEVVYLPQEIRVYLYGRLPEVESAKDVTGEVLLQRRNDQRAVRAELQYVAVPAGQQDYLSAPINLSGVRDGDLTATIKLANLPLQDRPGITLTQDVVVSRGRPQVVLAALDQRDQAGIARQQVCPVTGAALDSMGGPIKVLVGGQPLYLCCKGCLAKVQSAPEAYLRKASQAGPAGTANASSHGTHEGHSH